MPKNYFKKILLLATFALVLFLPATVHAGVCEEMAEFSGGFFSCGEESTTFTDFEGGLTPPSTAGYSEGLTQATNVREYILNITNFVLGFLGLAAVLVIIYGGIKYVTALGKEDKATEGKKAIEYAVIGLLIIMGSFLFVQAILQAPSGEESGDLSGSAPTQGTGIGQNQQRQAFFNHAGASVKTITRNFVTAYQNYSEINIDIQTILNGAEQNVRSVQELKQVLQDKKNILNNILGKAGTLSQIAEKAQAAILILDQTIKSSEDKVQNSIDDADDYALNTWEDFWLDDYGPYRRKIENAVEKGLQQANNEDFAQAVLKAGDELLELRFRIKQAADVLEIDQQFVFVLTKLKQIVPDIKTASIFEILFEKAFAQTLTGIPDNKTILVIVTELSKLYDLVKDLQFVYTVINTDINECNAPCIVNFDGLKSSDPNNYTIPDENYIWYFPNEEIRNGAAVPYTFDKAGTYIIKLEIKAPEANTANGQGQPANGIAYKTIVVKPPSSRIDLRVTIAGQEYILSEYNDSGFQTKNLQDITVTTTEAQSGIIFDASGTKTGQGEPFVNLDSSGPAQIKWDFGDKTSPSNSLQGAPDSIGTKQTVFYKQPGSYRVTLEVTDNRGIRDRKIFNIFVSSIAARIQVNPGNNGNIGQEFLMDGSASSSDNGQINDYTWKVLKQELTGTKELAPASLEGKDNITQIFDEAGMFDVFLTVNDGSSESTTSVEINVESKPPVAQFSVENKDKTQPNTYILDGSKSFDPDSKGKTNLEYKWDISAAPGECFYLEGENQTDCLDIFQDFKTDPKFKKIKLKFKKGNYTVGLDVQDPNEPGKSVPTEEEVRVDNDLDLAWAGEAGPITANLEDGEVEVSFIIKSDNAVAYELNTGDSEKESGDINGSTTVKHVYTQAGAYEVMLEVFDNEDNSNTISRKVFIAGDSGPVAAISLNINSEDITDTTEKILATRKSIIRLNAEKSINMDGNGRNLIFSWDLGDGTLSSKKELTHTYKELGTYNVTLKVISEDDPSLTATDELQIEIGSEKPIVRGINVIPISSELTTPLTVNLEAVGAEDPDGKIVIYRWWYFNLNDPDEKLGLQTSQGTVSTMAIGTHYEENTETTYGFAVSATDNENQIFDTSEKFNQDLVPTLTVINGPNKAPISKFSVDRSSITLGEVINFSSAAEDQDEDGEIVKYIWDFEGNGFADDILSDQYNKSNVQYTYEKAAPEGIRVKLKVIDNNGAEAISDPILIFIDGKAGDPVSAFVVKNILDKKVTFTNNSRADEAAGAKIGFYVWDFDITTDSDGDGIDDNDIDSNEEKPSYTYQNYGNYRVKLTVEDNEGKKSTVTNSIEVKIPTTNTTTTLEARLTSVPVANVSDGRIHLPGDKGTVIFNFGTSKGNIVKYIIDKNINHDSEGDGVRDNDEDHTATVGGTWSTQFLKSDGVIRTRLTVIDASGKKDTVEKDVVFDGTSTTPTLLGADIFAAGEVNLFLMLFITLFGFVIIKLKKTKPKVDQA